MFGLTREEVKLKRLRDYNNTVAYTKETGEKKGKQKEKLAAIKAGLEEEFSLNQISKFTRLTIEELKAIIKQKGW